MTSTLTKTRPYTNGDVRRIIEINDKLRSFESESRSETRGYYEMGQKVIGHMQEYPDFFARSISEYSRIMEEMFPNGRPY